MGLIIEDWDKDYLEGGLDMAVMQEFRINLTERAALKIREHLAGEGEGLVLRVFVMGQGCCGYRYGMVLDNEVLEDDIVIQNNGIRVVVDKYSASLITGSEIDYVEAGGVEGFVVKNPNEQSTCSCGGHHHSLIE
ncbi:Iron-sulfur cluster insertion protein ErpA [Candidatus Calditenuaceae archaeon HR02]|nr:Iron-sulfur cluster insertion protein ErpA [Candidatus Calditenuaceae archaeon HR02]